MAYKVVMTSKEYCDKLFHICFDLNTKYNNRYPYNLGYNHGNYWSWDCWNLNPKTIVWGWNENIPVGGYQAKNLETGLGDWNGWTILNCCNEISKDFSNVLPGEFLLTGDKSHAGAFVGEFVRNGKTYNTIECTVAFGGGVVPSYTASNGGRYSHKGGNRNNSWAWHGRLPWLDYQAEYQPLAVDGYWGMATTRYTQKMLCTTIDGIISSQPSRNKKYLPNAETTSWKFQLIGASGSQMIKALQKLIGAEADGFFGKASVTKLQEFLKAKGFYKDECDGYMGSNTVKAWQRYINAYFRA